jgi:hypothetical protein
MIDEEILTSAVIAKQYVHHAGFAGTARQIVADGYSAVDSMLGALLISRKVDPPRNHKLKLDRTRNLFPDAFAPRVRHGVNSTTYFAGVEWDSIESFYREWLEARYGDFAMSHNDAIQRFHDAGAAVARGIDVLASEAGMTTEAFNQIVLERAFGYEFSAADFAVGEVHERRFAEAERLGEINGSKLGTKFAETSNYCQLAIVSDDAMTQQILKEDTKIGAECAELYEKAIRLVELIDMKRSAELAPSPASDRTELFVHEHAPDFFLSIKFRFHGSKTSESARRFGRVFARGLQAASITAQSPTTD